IAKEVAKLLEMKAQLGGDEGKHKFVLKTPKGTRDYSPKQMAIRERVFNAIIACFKRHGAEVIDTPVFELKETLTGKYGEDSKLIYDLKDQGGELLSLRYDLTVPFARYLAMNKITNIKRYHIAKVYRRDNPAMTRGRYREFYQCVSPAVGRGCCVGLQKQKLLGGLQSCSINMDQPVAHGNNNHPGVPHQQNEGVSRQVASLACSSARLFFWKRPQPQKGLGGGQEAADNTAHSEQMSLLSWDRDAGPEPVLYCRQECDSHLATPSHLNEKVPELQVTQDLVHDLQALGIRNHRVELASDVKVLKHRRRAVSNSASLVWLQQYSLNSAVHSSLFTKSNRNGVIGIERIFSILEQRVEASEEKIRTTETQVLVASAQKKLLEERLKLISELWDAGIKAEVLYKKNPKLLNQLQYCEDTGIPLVAIVGEQELKDGVVKLRVVATREEVNVPRESLVEEIRTRTNR
ncbi:SYHC protein, partial [Caloenas nicobarica]|nr:SYHC protein [Caloenas nicobarica]